MSEPRSEWDTAWQGIEPQQPRPKRGGLVIALAAAVFLALGACALAYFVLQQRTTVEPGLTLPGEETATSVAAVAGTEQPTAETTAEPTGLAVAATATLPGDFATPPQPPPASDVVAPRAAAPPTIDGNAAEWAGLPVYSSPHVVFTGDTWDGSDDLAASWQVSWDDTYLYLIANVADDIHAQTQTGNLAFRGDSIELQIDADRAGDYGPTLSLDDFQISLSPGDFGAIAPSAFRFQGTASGEMRDATTPHTIAVTATPTGTGYVLEAAIPWRDLGITPAPGLVIGLAVNVNDNDRPGTAAQEMMKSSAPNRRFADPTTWGTLTLQ
ncbi:conserved protein of unknown function [Candidatus Promineifilum breve]|uniref:Carbohydrate-binding domain-containing protein n=1 Tax=Candidatus Promineifilum breve TaxID=1806508 RepID=A0A160T5F7_9CHLR|nr:sugar-binding protein [Candidatus Promineifilum breve]CUS05144.2 conserved protein of unknown function [Candidatus Promineifilum breve]